MIPEHFEMIRRRRDAFWWYVGRRHLFSGLLGRYLHAPVAVGLDAGCGPGTNEALYAPFARLWLCGDLDAESFAGRPLPNGASGFRADLGALPVRDGSVDLALLLDVLEHLPEERPALLEVYRTLRPGGLCLLSVPAFQALWSWHDQQAGHHRRYRLGQLASLASEAGFEVLEATYYNCLLAGPIFFARKALRRMDTMRGRIEADFSPDLLNGPFKVWLRFESRLSLAGLRLPWGTTAIVLARKGVAP